VAGVPAGKPYSLRVSSPRTRIISGYELKSCYHGGNTYLIYARALSPERARLMIYSEFSYIILIYSDYKYERSPEGERGRPKEERVILRARRARSRCFRFAYLLLSSNFY